MVARTGEPYLIRRHPGAQFDNVWTRARSIVVVGTVANSVLPGTNAETVGVGAVATREPVVSYATVKGVISIITAIIIITAI